VNGIKYKASYGSSALPSIVAQIEQELESGVQGGVLPLPPRQDLISALEPRAPYLDALEKLVDWKRLRDAKFRFVFDPMHGSAAGLLPELFGRNGIHSDEIAGRATRVSAACIPSRLSRTSKTCARLCVPENTTPASARTEMATASGHRPRRFVRQSSPDLCAARVAPGRNPQLAGRYRKTFSVTKLIDKLAAKFSRKLHETPIGFKYICELMLEQNILIGGEESGASVLTSTCPSATPQSPRSSSRGDGLARQISWRTARRTPFGIREYHYSRVDLDLETRQKGKSHRSLLEWKLNRILDLPVVRREDMDGIKVYLGEAGWVMVRASGTENLCACIRKRQSLKPRCAFSKL